MTTILTTTIYEIAPSCGPLAFLERLSGINQPQTGTRRLEVSFLVRLPTLVPQGLAADQHVESLRTHKYPIPGGAHYGVQIKVSSSGFTPDVHSLRQQDVQQLWERHSQDH